MLKSLNIENIAIIEKATVEFSSGLNILTGETGAGKSILIDSINAVTGEKTSRELIRTGEDYAQVSAYFEDVSSDVTKKLSENGLPYEDDNTLILQRKIMRDGKNICRINGFPVNVSTLKSIGMSVINIHGQKDSQALLNTENHIDYLDSFAEINHLKEAYTEIFNEYRKTKNEIKALTLREEEKENRLQILEFQIDEIKNANITVGEKEKLIKKRNILNNSRKLTEALTTALISLTGDGGSIGADSLITSAINDIDRVNTLAKGLDLLKENLVNANSLIEESVKLLSDALRQLEDIDGNIDKIEERLDLLYRFSKKYGETEQDMLDYLEKAEREVQNITNNSELLAHLNILVGKQLANCMEKAKALSLKRREAAKKLSSAIKYELSFLDMPSCKFEVALTNVEMNESGCDAVEFLISANAGEELKPLIKVASGGELSRVMLAIKNVISKKDSVGTMIFDEIDTGVSGSAARRIAIKLNEVSKSGQVLCITHLAQIAAFADVHKYIYKEEKNGKTYTRITELGDDERPQELSRMANGIKNDDIYIDSAKRMIESAKAEKEKIKA